MSLRKLIRHLCIIGVLLPNVTLAVGLGVITNYSHLNQTINAQISIIALGDIPLDSVRAELATPALFKHIGLPYSSELNKLRFDLLRAQDGTPYIHVYSRQVIIEPNISFLLQLAWPGGQVMRQYTVLLSPDTPAAANKAKRKALKPLSTSLPKSKTTHGKLAKQYGPIKSDDRLWAIATHNKPDPSVSIPQTAAAIFLLNSYAFQHNSPSQLRQGVMLQLPSLNVVQRIPHTIAKQILQQHAVDVTKLQKQYHIKPVTSATMQHKAARSAKKPANVRQPKNTHNSKPISSKQHTTAVSKSSTSTTKSNTTTTVKQDLTKAQKENKQLVTQLATLQRQHDMLVLANQQQVKRIVSLEAKITALQAANQLPKKTAKPEKQPSLPASAATNTTSKPLISSIKETAKKSPIPLSKYSHSNNTGKINMLTKLAWLVAMVVLGLLIIYWLYTRWQRRREEVAIDEEFAQQSEKYSAGKINSEASNLIFTEGDEGSDTQQPQSTAEPESDNTHTETTTDDTDTYQLHETDSFIDIGNTDTPNTSEEQSPTNQHTVQEEDTAVLTDPLEEAEVYLAYGRFEQAEQVLLTALSRQPDHHAWRIKLLEIYANMQDKDKFEQALTVLPSSVLEQHPQWQNTIASLRQQVETSDTSNLQEEDQTERTDETQGTEERESIPFTPKLGLNLAIDDDTKEDSSETITANEALQRAKQHLIAGEYQDAKELLSQVCEKGNDEEQEMAKKLLDDIDD